MFIVCSHFIAQILATHMRPWVDLHTMLYNIMHCSVRYTDVIATWFKTQGLTTTGSIHKAELECTLRRHNCTYPSLP